MQPVMDQKKLKALVYYIEVGTTTREGVKDLEELEEIEELRKVEELCEVKDPKKL